MLRCAEEGLGRGGRRPAGAPSLHSARTLGRTLAAGSGFSLGVGAWGGGSWGEGEGGVGGGVLKASGEGLPEGVDSRRNPSARVDNNSSCTNKERSARSVSTCCFSNSVNSGSHNLQRKNKTTPAYIIYNGNRMKSYDRQGKHTMKAHSEGERGRLSWLISPTSECTEFSQQLQGISLTPASWGHCNYLLYIITNDTIIAHISTVFGVKGYSIAMIRYVSRNRSHDTTTKRYI